jgi:AraC family transcriptional regulator, regulatory protein of adaptative response / methylated-DNA-[protein]-cysteine methyltransferase
MCETIRYAFGHSTLGAFLAATSARGLVAFEFGERRETLVATLRQRFPDAAVEQDDTNLSAMIDELASLVDHPEREPSLPLDLRGSAYQKHVWEILRQVPAGQTITYGAVAANLGTPRDARDATEAIAANGIAILIPCHRVVKKDGSLSGYRWGTRRKRALLAREQTASALRLA